MRTESTLDVQISKQIRKEVKIGKRSLNAAINDTPRQATGLETPKPMKPYRVNAHSSTFAPGADPRCLNQLVDELETEEFLANASRSYQHPRHLG